MSKKFGSVLVACAALSVVSSFQATPAAAATTSIRGCNYPYACIYSDNQYMEWGHVDAAHIVGRYRDMGYWQNPTDRFGWGLANTRNDDVVLIRLSATGSTADDGTRGIVCVRPRQAMIGEGELQMIMISSASSCGNYPSSDGAEVEAFYGWEYGGKWNVAPRW